MKTLFMALLILPFLSFAKPVTFHITGKKNKTYSGLKVNNIVLNNDTNIIITHCNIKNSTAIGIQIQHCSHITIYFDTVENVRSGVYALESSAIVVTHNYMQNMRGPMPQAQFVQFDNVKGAGSEVAYNNLVNIAGQSHPEDAINMYESSGTKNSPILIAVNRIKGGGPSTTGSGIMMGDTGGSYQTAIGNILVDPGQCGIGVAGGSNMIVKNNTIYARKQPFTNVGIYVWNQSKKGCAIVTVTGNRVLWVDHSGKENEYWDGANCGKITGWSTNITDKKLTSAILPAKM